MSEKTIQQKLFESTIFAQIIKQPSVKIKLIQSVSQIWAS